MPVKKNQRKELMSRRAFFVLGGQLGLLSALFAKTSYMQLIKGMEYKMLSDKNRITFIILQPDRGNIYDVMGNAVATNKSCFSLFINKNAGSNSSSYNSELSIIAELLDLKPDTISAMNYNIDNGLKYRPVLLLDDINWKQMSIIEERIYQLPNCFIQKMYKRLYPFASISSHLLGYVGKLNKQEMASPNIAHDNLIIGKCGIEKYYEDQLRGKCGYKEIEVNAMGKQIREIYTQKSQKGSDLHLNIDINLQSRIMQSLNNQIASAIVMDCSNGKILALASTPNFDPNQFNKLSKQYWSDLINNPHKPMLNHAVQSSYSPGSVFKLVTFIAALKLGISHDTIIRCTSQSALGNKYFHCASRFGHGAINMIEAIERSCNSYVFAIAKMIGAEIILDTASQLGFGSITYADLPGEVAGFIPSISWKQEKFKEKWNLADTLNISIGQGAISVTPIQLARFVTAIATQGKLYRPKIAQNNQKDQRAVYVESDIASEHFDIIRRSMYNAVNSAKGTAYSSRVTGGILAGKTGTAQVQSKKSRDDDLSRSSIPWKQRNHGVFIGFAPYDNPKYSVTVFAPHGGSGSKAAAPLAKNIVNILIS
ncbi:MAG: penicillin-binding protein 2 [Rickettsiaceae bacterium]